jgi:hypothetical protein
MLKTVKILLLSLSLFTYACNKTGFDEKANSGNIFISGDPILVQSYRSFFENEKSGPSINLQSDNKNFSFVANFPKIYENPTLDLSENNSLRAAFDVNMNVNPSATVFSSEDPNLKNLFGTEAYFTVNIPNIGASKEKLYVPNLLKASILMKDGYPVTKSSGLALNWAVDRNPLNDKGVLVELFYDASANKSTNVNASSLPSQSITKYIVVPDDGNYLLSKVDLAELPSNANITIKIYRGNFKTATIGKEQEISLLVYDQFYNAFTLVD